MAVFRDISKVLLYNPDGSPLYRNHSWVKNLRILVAYTKIYTCYKCNGELTIEKKLDPFDILSSKEIITVKTNVADLNCEDAIIKDIIE